MLSVTMCSFWCMPMSIGDIIIIPTTPPHLASVTADGMAICEDGTSCAIPADATVAATALEIIKSLESEVLRQNGAG